MAAKTPDPVRVQVNPGDTTRIFRCSVEAYQI